MRSTTRSTRTNKVSTTLMRMTAPLALAASAGLAHAELPAALDRVPDSALVTASIGNLEAFIGDARQLQGGLDMLGGGAEAIGAAGQLLETDGIDRDGSVALAMMPNADGGEPNLLLIAPVDDFDAFVGSFDGETVGNISSFEFQGQRMHAKSIGGGYAALSPDDETITTFTGEGGKLGIHESLAGPTGARVAADSDTIVIANIQLLKPQLEEGYEGLKGQMKMMAMMAGPQAGDMEAQMEALDVIAASFLRDAKVGIVGLDVSADGLAIDLASQFAEGSEIAGFFKSAGDSSKLLTKVPDMEFLIAGAGDFSAPGIQQLLKNSNELNSQMNAGAMTMDMGEFWTASEGMAGVLGASPGLLGGGLFSKSVVFISGEPEATRGAMQDIYTNMNDQTIEGMTYSTSYDTGSVEIEGQKVDTWTMGMKVDPAHPQAMMMQQSMMMMLGPQMGFSGYAAAVEGGYVTTYAKNTALMKDALSAAGGDGGLGGSDAIEKIASELPEDRFAEAYLGTKTLMSYARMAMSMMGGGAQFDVPDQLDPIGVGISGNEGGFRARTYITKDVLNTIGQFQNQGGGGGGGNQGGGGPRF